MTSQIAGCASPATEYCLLTDYIYFEDKAVIADLIVKDEDLVRSIVTHNETRAKLCD